ncbi:MAG: hypothetical protein JWN86_4491 [Planctomycetota bacterium]|nr:hypothetical protein [Planctomycetota bacterium]
MSGMARDDDRLSEVKPESGPGPGRRAAVLAGIVSMLAGLLISVAPHLAWWAKSGEPVYIADHDDTFYLAYTTQAFFQHPLRITDPILKTGGSSQFPRVQLVPPVVLAKGLGLRPVDVLLLWRIWGGLSIGLACYCLALIIVKRPWVAAGVAILFFSDTSVVIGRPIVRSLLLAARAATGGLTVADIGKRPNLMPHWRLITPSVSFAFLLAHTSLMLHAREKPTRSNIVLAGIGFGLLFHVYFYFWTAAMVALGLVWLVDTGHRRVPFMVGLIGLTLGCPSILANVRFKWDYPSDWLYRMDNFLPIPRTSEWLIPWGTIAILAVAVPWAFFRRRELSYVACMAVAGLIMVNHQLATGVQIQNWHWCYVWGPFTWFLVVFELLPIVQRATTRSRNLRITVSAGVLALYGFGLYLRACESTRAPDSRLVQSLYWSYRDQKRSPGWPAFSPNEVVAGDPGFLEIAGMAEDLRPLDHYALTASPSTLEPEREERIALNAVLRGMTRDAFRAWQAEELSGGWGPWLRDPALREEKLARMLSRFERLSENRSADVRRFQIRYLGLPAGSSDKHLGAGWGRLQSGPTWDIYEYLDRSKNSSPGT